MLQLDFIILAFSIAVLLWIVRFSLLAFWPDNGFSRFFSRDGD
ncbi:MAG: hypothetical protein AAF390_12945 [Pseudomonadota bacterium]